MTQYTADAVEFLKELSDRELYDAIERILEHRRVSEYSEAVDEYGNATRMAKLAVVKQIICP